MKRGAISIVAALALAACGSSALAEWQCLSAGATAPAAARAASDYLGRAERVYSAQLLGVLRSSGRVFLVNARDDGWSERVRLGLLELRLAEPDITAARRFQDTVAGTQLFEAGRVPGGDFLCLSRERAARHGLAFSSGAVLLAAGKTVHFVDPAEPGIAVEVKAIGSQPLDFREILAASGRAGIYAGLAGGRAQPGTTVAVRHPEGAVIIPVGPARRPDGEIVITPRAGEVTENAAATGAADASLANPMPRETPAAVVVEVAMPVSSAALVGASAARRDRPVAEQPYGDYAKTMKALLELRRSGGVRSISEITYVHPAIEDWRSRR